MWRREHGWRSCTPRGARVLKKWKTRQPAAPFVHPGGRAPVLDPTSPTVHGDSPAWGAPRSRESFGAVKNHFPKHIAALLALEGLKAPQKINGWAHRVLLGGNTAKAEATPGEGGISAAWDAAPCGFGSCFLHNQRMRSPPSTQCNSSSARRGRSPRPLTLNPENYDFMTFPFFFFLS